MKLIKLSVIAIVCFVFSVNAQTLTGKVISITDGDTFKLLIQDSIQHNVRLANIDCPERAQPFSNKAKQFLSDAIFGKEITIEVIKTDRYKRLVAIVLYDGGKNVNQELVKNGLAWHYVKYSNDTTLQALEDTARQNKVGLWQDINAIAPWEWRNNRSKNHRP